MEITVSFFVTERINAHSFHKKKLNKNRSSYQPVIEMADFFVVSLGWKINLNSLFIKANWDIDNIAIDRK